MSKLKLSLPAACLYPSSMTSGLGAFNTCLYAVGSNLISIFVCECVPITSPAIPVYASCLTTFPLTASPP